MMNKKLCRYSIVRFKPYPETGEFVNVGVIAVFPQAGILDFKLEITHTQRITNFFQSIDYNFYRDSARLFYKALDDIREKLNYTPLIRREPEAMDEYFDLLTKEYDEIFCFSKPRVKFTTEVLKETENLYACFVQHNRFVKNVSHEEEMTSKVRRQLKRLNMLDKYLDYTLILQSGVDLQLPFCHFNEDEVIVKAIRPIYLGYRHNQRVIEHGAGWYYRLKKAAEEAKLPKKMLIIFGGDEKLQNDNWHTAIEVIKSDIAGIANVEIADNNRIEILENFIQNVC
jgi:hypothetical protein